MQRRPLHKRNESEHDDLRVNAVTVHPTDSCFFFFFGLGFNQINCLNKELVQLWSYLLLKICINY